MDPLARRDAILDEIRQWRDEGLIDEDTARRLAARYGEEAGALLPPAEGPRRSGFAADALQFVGGLLLGAALIALVVFLDVSDAAAAHSLLGLGFAALAAGLALHALAPARGGLAEALLSAGLVPTAVAPFFAMDGDAQPWVGILAALLAVAVHAMRRGRGPSVVVAGFAFAIGSFAATGVEFFWGGPGLVPRLLWLLALLAYFGLLLVWRREAWSTVALGLVVAPLTLGFVLLLEELGAASSTLVELVVGAWLGAFLAVGVLLKNRGLVAGAAAGLTIDAVVFAFDVGGPGTAVVVLLALGGLLVWQAEILRAWFGGRPGGGRP